MISEGWCQWHLLGTSQKSAKQPTLHRTVPHNDDYWAPNFCNVDLQKARLRSSQKAFPDFSHGITYFLLIFHALASLN